MNERPLGIVHNCSHLRKLIMENPDMPIAIMVHQDACSDEYAYTYCSDVSASVGELLDCELPFGDGLVLTDRTDLRESLQLYLEDLDEYTSRLQMARPGAHHSARHSRHSAGAQSNPVCSAPVLNLADTTLLTGHF